MELLCLLMFVVTWIAYVKLRRFYKLVPNIVAACIILHNLCEMYGDHFQSEWEVNEHTEAEMDTSRTSTRSQTASDIRTALTQYLSNN